MQIYTMKNAEHNLKNSYEVTISYFASMFIQQNN